ncbi:MAG: DUF6286 domain-containing protein [Actinomycetota bacterium]|nr:DUF6286 domain-containing protein [Actinomycetota bacterium]
MLNRILAVILGIGLFVLGIAVPIEIVRAALHRKREWLPYDHWTRLLRHNIWTGGGIRTLLIGLAALGLVLLYLQLRPRKPTLLPLEQMTEGVDVGTTRRSLQSAIKSAATGVDGIDSASVHVGQRQATVVAFSPLSDVSGLEPQVSERAQDRLGQLQLARPPRVVVKVRQKDKR